MLYLDASALAKRYIREAGHTSLEQRLQEDELVYSSAICYAEVHAALARKLREGGWNRTEFLQARNRFEVDWLLVREIAVDGETLAPVSQLVEHVPLRGMDAIHLAAAVWLQRKTGHRAEFITTDARLAAAARQFGFLVWNPATENSG
ncbi:MAG: type II toxin-antitoxin system VapC family toxin [Terriglobia bacterium]